MCPSIALADRGYKAAETPPGTRLLLSHTRRLPARLNKLLRRRQAIEPTIGHMKNDGLLDRNWLKGEIGDAMHVLLCGAGHNLRLILAALRAFLTLVLAVYGAVLGSAAIAFSRPAGAKG